MEHINSLSFWDVAAIVVAWEIWSAITSVIWNYLFHRKSKPENTLEFSIKPIHEVQVCENGVVKIYKVKGFVEGPV